MNAGAIACEVPGTSQQARASRHKAFAKLAAIAVSCPPSAAKKNGTGDIATSWSAKVSIGGRTASTATRPLP